MKLIDLTKEELIELIPEDMKVDEERTVADFLHHRSVLCLEKVCELSRSWSNIDEEIRTLLSDFTPERVVEGKKFYYNLPKEVRDKCQELIEKANETWKKRIEAWDKYMEVSDRSQCAWLDLSERWEKERG